MYMRVRSIRNRDRIANQRMIKIDVNSTVQEAFAAMLSRSKYM